MKELFQNALSYIYKPVAILFFAIFAFISYLLLLYAAFNILYFKDDLNYFEEKLNAIPNVEVIDIYGYVDYYIESVHARVNIKDKGTILLSYIDDDRYAYPKHVIIKEVNGYKLEAYCWDNNGDFDREYNIDIGTNGYLGEVIGLTFNSVEDVINNFDSISSFVERLKPFPELTHFETSQSDVYISKRTYVPEYFTHHGHMNKLHLDVLFLENGCKNKEEFFEKLRKDY